MFCIKSITCRQVLNSHVSFTNEFIVELDDGAVGTGASPQGETISIYEDRRVTIEPETIIQKIRENGYLFRPLDQASFDDYLQDHVSAFGRNNAYGLSLAFFDAVCRSTSPFALEPPTKMVAPRICLNILNGGWHAYTNAVQSDLTEFLLVSKSNTPEEVIASHNEIQQLVKERLLRQSKTIVSGNPVSCFATADNRECIDFLLDILVRLGLSAQFDLMIDASASDLWTEEGYRLAITDHSVRSSEEFYAYWRDLLKQYDIRFLEDPFHEKDFSAWRCLTTSQHACRVIGDNLYSSDAERIEAGARNQLTHGVVIKPNQAGTITAVRRAIQAAQRNDQIAITSHRSISTESTFLSLLTCVHHIPYIKIGPLTSDYSSVIRLNELIRLTEEPVCP